MMTLDEIMRRVLQVFPDAVLDQDYDGQVIVYTNLYPGGTVNCTVYCAPPPKDSDD